MSEAVLPLAGYEGAYVVSESGVVSSVDRCVFASGIHPHSRNYRGVVIAQAENEFGYMTVSVRKNGKSKKIKVHRAVMMSFFPRQDADKLDVNHKDGNKKNNSIENLEWCTRGENHKHRYRVLKQKHSMCGAFGAAHHRSVPVVATSVDEPSKFMMFDSMMDAERAGYSSSKISLCLSGKRKTHAGMKWSAAV